MNSQVDETYYDGLHEECGVFGVYDLDGGDVASTIYYGLFALQHRGQESCGIAVSDTKGPKGKVLSSKGMGLVNEVFTQDNLESLILKNLKNSKEISGLDMSATRRQVRAMDRMYSR